MGVKGLRCVRASFLEIVLCCLFSAMLPFSGGHEKHMGNPKTQETALFLR